MSILRTFRRLRAITLRKPVLEISRSGQRTKRPKVHLSLVSKRGMITLYTQPDNARGNAQIEMYGDTLHSISGLAVWDDRPYQERAAYDAVDISPGDILEAANNLQTHKRAWINAIDIAQATASGREADDKSYWDHERKVLIHACDVLGVDL